MSNWTNHLVLIRTTSPQIIMNHLVLFHPIKKKKVLTRIQIVYLLNRYFFLKLSSINDYENPKKIMKIENSTIYISKGKGFYSLELKNFRGKNSAILAS